MSDLASVAPAFVEMAHRIVWSSVATVGAGGRPRSRILHPLWQWDGTELVGWIATGPTPVKRAHLESNPYLSASYWASTHDTCVADCRATWAFDDETRTWLWQLFKDAPVPVGYDPGLIPAWVGRPHVAGVRGAASRAPAPLGLPGHGHARRGRRGADVVRRPRPRTLSRLPTAGSRCAR